MTKNKLTYYTGILQGLLHNHVDLNLTVCNSFFNILITSTFFIYEICLQNNLLH